MTKFKEGDKVISKEFGEGVVEKIHTVGQGWAKTIEVYVQVRFADNFVQYFTARGHHDRFVTNNKKDIRLVEEEINERV